LTAGWLEAFKGRGNGDFLVSHDLGDVVTVVDGRPALIDELRGAPEELRTYIATEIRRALAHTSISRCPSGPSSRRLLESVPRALS
jgi:hypothetical protein